MSHVLTFMLCLAGFAALALATQRQQEGLWGRALAAGTSRRLWIAGWCALTGALAVAVSAWGWALGLVVYSGHTSLCAGLVFVVLIVVARYRSVKEQTPL